jgi:hypothetical protein
MSEEVKFIRGNNRMSHQPHGTAHGQARDPEGATRDSGPGTLAAPPPVVARGAELWGAGRVIRVPDSVAKAVIAAGE